MTPRPLYRWKSFWLGVLVLAFLGWAWGLSYDYVSKANWRAMGVSQLVGYVTVGGGGNGTTAHAEHNRARRGQNIPKLMPLPFLARGKGGIRGILEEPLEFQEKVKWSYALLPRDYWRVYVPHWMVMLGFGVPWVGFLVWRRRRMRRLIESIA